jgi:hypothetical protein
MELKDTLDKWMEERKVVLIQNYQAHKASGDFGKSIKIDTKENESVMTGNRYIGAVVNGRRASSAGGKGSTALYDQIVQWIEDKGIQPKDDISKKSLAFLITRHIHKFGIKIPNEYNDGKLLDDTFTQESIEDLKSRLGKNIVTQITSDIKKTWQ